MSLDPKLIVLDELVSALDVSIQARVLNLLEELHQRLGCAYLFIAHDPGVIHKLIVAERRRDGDRLKAQ